MFGFLQGFAYGLFISCLPWLIIGMASPRVALPTEFPSRWQVLLRYWLLIPFCSFLIWLTSLWGGFGPTLFGWLAGLGAIAVAIPIERRWRRWRTARTVRRLEARQEAEAKRRRVVLEREEREAGLVVLDPGTPPADADEVTLALCAAKQRLLEARRPDLAVQADRLYTRYAHVLDVLEKKFDKRELTYERSYGLVAGVCRSSVDNLVAMASQAAAVMRIDAKFVRRRLTRDSERLPADEQEALQRRLELVDDTEARLRELSARNEAAMTALDDTTVALAALETERPQASVTADQALEDLRRFVDNAERYNVSKSDSVRINRP